jgi:hypothetical protein
MPSNDSRQRTAKARASGPGWRPQPPGSVRDEWAAPIGRRLLPAGIRCTIRAHPEQRGGQTRAVLSEPPVQHQRRSIPAHAEGAGKPASLNSRPSRALGRWARESARGSSA